VGLSELFISLNMDFMERQYEYTYYSLFDFITAMGGFKGFIDPLMMIIIPLLCMNYQNQLAYILKERSGKSIRDDTLASL
jgi:hypothetical protein